MFFKHEPQQVEGSERTASFMVVPRSTPARPHSGHYALRPFDGDMDRACGLVFLHIWSCDTSNPDAIIAAQPLAHRMGHSPRGLFTHCSMLIQNLLRHTQL